MYSPRTHNRESRQEAVQLNSLRSRRHRGHALTAVRQAAPDVVLIDINLPGASGLEATQQTTQISPAVLVISMVDDDSVFAAMAADARASRNACSAHRDP